VACTAKYGTDCSEENSLRILGQVLTDLIMAASEQDTRSIAHISAGYTLLRRFAECNSDDMYLGNFEDVGDCAEACALVPGCHFFIHGLAASPYAGDNSGSCWYEFASGPTCADEGWEPDSYNFYELSDGTIVAQGGTQLTLTDVLGLIAFQNYNHADYVVSLFEIGQSMCESSDEHLLGSGCCIAHGRHPDWQYKTWQEVLDVESVSSILGPELHARLTTKANAGGGWIEYSWNSGAISKTKRAWVSPSTTVVEMDSQQIGAYLLVEYFTDEPPVRETLSVFSLSPTPLSYQDRPPAATGKAEGERSPYSLRVTLAHRVTSCLVGSAPTRRKSSVRGTRRHLGHRSRTTSGTSLSYW
jgi:hypothetical protein